jgi:hypothetical protein
MVLEVLEAVVALAAVVVRWRVSRAWPWSGGVTTVEVVARTLEDRAFVQ